MVNINQDVPGGVETLGEVTIIETAWKKCRSVYRVADRTSHLAGTAGYSTPSDMSSTFRMLQLNVRKQSMVQQSLMNDEALQDFGVLAITEPHIWKRGDALITVPTAHSNWTRMIPTVQEEGRWAVRSMLWIRKDLEAEQIAVESSELTAAVLRLPDRAMLVVSVYVSGHHAEALMRTVGLLRRLIHAVRNKVGTRTDVVLAGDFNRHDQLWGGNDISPTRQGEAIPIIDLMNEHAVLSLLPRGTKTWQSGNRDSTIDLMLASKELAATVVKYDVHDTEYGSDHRAIETEFDVAPPERHVEPRLLWKNVPWGQIRDRVEIGLRVTPRGDNTQE